MERSCLKCGDVNATATGTQVEACPSCGAIYSKVERPLSPDEIRAAEKRAEVAKKAADAREKKEADAAWQVQAEAIRANARKEIAAKKALEKIVAATPKAPTSQAQTSGLVCVRCSHVGKPKRAVRGSMGLEIALWLVGLVTIFVVIGVPILIVALIYSVWRMFSRRNVCKVCGSEQLIPATSPRGQAIIKQLTTDSE